MPDKTFEYTANLLQEIPEDTVYYQFPSEQAFGYIAILLVRSGHVFVTSPSHGQIAMSRAAAIEIGLLG
jgi:hypothetical protein